MKNELKQEAEVPRLIYFPEVKNLTGLSRSTVWKLEKAGAFPRRRLITANRVAWLETDVHSWIKSRVEVEGSEVQPKHNLPKNSCSPSSSPPTASRAASGEQRKRPSWMDRDDDLS